jgi:hypothetical protein
VGCSNSNTAGPDMAMAGPDLTTSGAADLPPPNPDALTTAYNGQFIGYWGVKAKIETIQTLPFLGATHSTNTFLSVGQFRLDMSNNLVFDQQECRVTVKSANPGITTNVPDKIADTTPLLTGIVQVYGTAGDLGFHRAQVATGIGCNLVNPVTDVLPTVKTDPRVFDQDMDTNPGVTVMPQTPIMGNVYVVERRLYSYENGLVVSPTQLSGSVVDRSEQYILDADVPALKTQVPTMPVDAMSVFQMVKLSTQYDCTRLKAEAPTLFTLQ